MSDKEHFSYWAPIFGEPDFPEFRDRSSFIMSLDGVAFDERTIGTHLVPYEVRVSLAQAPQYLVNSLSKSKQHMLDLTRRKFELALKFRFSSSYPGDQMWSEQIEADVSKHSPRDWWRSWTDDQARSVLQKFTISSQLSWPYSRPPMDYYRFSEQKLIRHQKFPFSPLTGAYPEAENAGYKIRDNLDVLRLAKFLFGEKAEKHSARLTKLISYLSYMFTKETLHARKSEIVWACAALESFYSTGNTGRSDELRRHLPLFLQTEAKKTARDISKVYARRSKFLHGNERIRSIFEYKDIGPSDDNEYRDTNLAVYFAIETLRKIIQDDLRDVEFVRDVKKTRY